MITPPFIGYSILSVFIGVHLWFRFFDSRIPDYGAGIFDCWQGAASRSGNSATDKCKICIMLAINNLQNEFLKSACLRPSFTSFPSVNF